MCVCMALLMGTKTWIHTNVPRTSCHCGDLHSGPHNDGSKASFWGPEPFPKISSKSLQGRISWQMCVEYTHFTVCEKSAMRWSQQVHFKRHSSYRQFTNVDHNRMSISTYLLSLSLMVHSPSGKTVDSSVEQLSSLGHRQYRYVVFSTA